MATRCFTAKPGTGMLPQSCSCTVSRQPPTLILWGKNDPFFTVEGAKAYQRDLPKAGLNLLDAGHFALEEEGDFIAERIKAFLS
jgi:pimeloyl-ACP methyl ester carboxylesterase